MRHIAAPRIASLLAAVIAGALAVYVLRPDSGVRSAAHLKAQTPEVRTQVIKRTVHVVRHERPPSGRRAHGAGVVSAGGATAAAQAGVAAAPRSATSGSSAAPATGTAGAGAPVRTSTSGSSGGSGSGGGTVRTHTSGGGEGGDHEGGSDD